ncbi:MAG: hypothetical protein ACKVWR_22170 [Acidimicrobiales bacterium]
MLTTGFKHYVGMAGAFFVAAVVYGWTSGAADWHALRTMGWDSELTEHLARFIGSTLGALTLGYKGAVGDHVGYTILLGAAAVSLTLGLVSVAIRDADARSLAEVARTPEAPPLRLAGTPNYWGPLVGFSVGVGVLGLAISEAFFWIGAGLFAFVGIEWMMQAWADRATADPAANQALRNRLMNPIEVPVAGALVIAFVVIGFSRVLLTVSELGSVVVGIGVAAVIFLVAAALAVRPKLDKNLVTGLLVAFALAVLAGGIIGVARGEREYHPHEPGVEHEGESAESHS